MRKIYTVILILCFAQLNAQKLRLNATLDPQKVFIENRSQFNSQNDLAGSEILFATETNASQLLFTKTGLTFLFQKRERPEVEEREERKEGMTHKDLEEQEGAVNIVTDFVQMEWLNANTDCEVIASQQAGHYYNYKMGSYSINEVKAFEKLTYKNLYPNVDVEYIFHQETGIKYSIILHAGADASKIKMKYSGASEIFFDNAANLHLATMFGDIIDHAPVTFYSENKNPIASKFIKKGKTISFEIGQYDQTKEVIIDPWTVNPVFPNSNRVFNIEADSLGNAYIYGGDSPFKLQKYNTSGALQWTFTNGWDSAGYWFGTLIVDRAGNSIITAGTSPEITKVNTTGGQVWNDNGGFLDEYWSLAFNCDETQLLCGGTRLTGIPLPNGSGRIYDINPNNGSVINSVKVSNFVPSFLINDPNEVRSICASPNGNFYFLSLDTLGSLNPTLGINWRTPSGYRFGYGSPNYGFTPQGQSIIRATDTHIYTANGDSVRKRDINTGVTVAAAPIPGGGHANTFLVPGTLPKNGGLAIDSCGNVYAGSQSNVTKFDSNLNFIMSVNTPSAVYDVAVANNGEVLASGNGFAASLYMAACPQIKTICNILPITQLSSSDSSVCENQCIDFTDLSLNNPTSWLWTFSGAQTTTSTLQNPTGICYATPGNYDVTLIACNQYGCDTLLFTAFIHVDGTPVISLGNDTLICAGDSVLLSPGSGFTSYLWSNNSTTQSIFATSGTYAVQIYLGNCIATDTVEITTQACNNVIIALASSDTSFCEKQCIDFFDLSQNNPTSWQWIFQGATPDTSTMQNPTDICYNNYGSFDVTLIACNAFGCDTLVFSNFINEYQNPTDSVWQSNDTLYSLPAVSYQWYEVTNGAITGAVNSFYVTTQPGTYYCIVIDSIGCAATSNSIVISGLEQITNAANIQIQPNPGSGIFTITGNLLLNKNVLLKLYDVSGKLILEKELQQNSNVKLDLSHLADGIYDVQFTGGTNTLNQKLIIKK